MDLGEDLGGWEDPFIPWLFYLLFIYLCLKCVFFFFSFSFFVLFFSFLFSLFFSLCFIFLRIVIFV